MANRIHSKGIFRHEEAKAAEAGIYPGMLLRLDANGEMEIHDVEGGELGDETLIAEEDALQGNTVDTVYADDAIVSYMIPQKGSVINMLVEDGQDLAIGEKVMSAGNGTVKAIDDLESGETLAHVIGIAEEAIDLTGSAVLNVISPIRIV